MLICVDCMVGHSDKNSLRSSLVQKLDYIGLVCRISGPMNRRVDNDFEKWQAGEEPMVDSPCHALVGRKGEG